MVMKGAESASIMSWKPGIGYWIFSKFAKNDGLIDCNTQQMFFKIWSKLQNRSLFVLYRSFHNAYRNVAQIGLQIKSINVVQGI